MTSQMNKEIVEPSFGYKENSMPARRPGASDVCETAATLTSTAFPFLSFSTGSFPQLPVTNPVCAKRFRFKDLIKVLIVFVALLQE